jgi:2-polyprenyl-6-methoxyphenol hydroxylase-like FAD-dependent oxidoreductase
MSKSTTPVLNRRTALAGAGTAGALAAAAVALPGAGKAPVVVAEVKPAPEQGGGYQLTDHVRRYYQTTKV